VSTLVGVCKQSVVKDAVAGMHVVLQVLEDIEVHRRSGGGRRVCVPDRRVREEA